MAKKKITDLSAATALDGSEFIEVVQGGDSKESTTGDVATLAASLIDLSVKQDVNARSTLFRAVTELDPGANYNIQATDKNKHFLWELTVGRSFIFPAGLPTVGNNNYINIGASFKLTNRASSAANATLDVSAVTFEGSTTVTAGTTIEVTRIDTNIYLRS